MKRLIDFSSRFRILKGGKISLVVSALLGTTTLSFAAPSGGVVTSGSANISQVGNTTNIIQNTGNVTINWDKFNIASDEIVNFKQPDVNSIALNRVVGNEKSIINGALNANGQVWILNSNGVLFGKNAKINTAGLLATTKNLSDDDFNNKNYNFKGSSSESVINLGEIDISDSGYATLIANTVSNEGTIKAVRGSVRLVGADEVSINLNGNSIVDLTVNKGVLDSLVENKGAIYADGGEIYLTTNAVDELLKGVVNNEGIIEANSLDGVTGFVELFAHDGEAKIGGTITAKEGFVETSGKDFTFNDAKIEAGEWLIDPVDITIDQALADAIEGQLDSGNVTIETDANNNPDTSANESGSGGDIFVTGNIEYTGTNDSSLTLKAYRNIIFGDSFTPTTKGSISSTSAALDVTLWSRAGGNNEATDGRVGSVWLPQGSSISTNGGDVIIGGGQDALSGYALGSYTISGENNSLFRGVSINGDINVSEGFDLPGGNIFIRGKGSTSQNVSAARGVSIAGGSTVRTTGDGNITIYGIAKGSSSAVGLGDDFFTELDSTGSVSTTYGDIYINAKNDNSEHNSINVEGDSLIFANYGDMVLNANDSNIFFNNGIAANNLLFLNANNVTINNLSTVNSLVGSNITGNLLFANERSLSIGHYIYDGIEYKGLVLGGNINISTQSGEKNPSNIDINENVYSLNGDTHFDISGAINVNTNLSWDTQSKLTLKANSINVNAEIKNTNTTNGGVYFDVFDSSFNVNFGQNGKVVINNVHQLQWINTALSGNYELGSDIDASDTINWNNGTGWTAIGNATTTFTGNFDGLGHNIDSLYINNSLDYQGLFGYISQGSTISNLGLTNAHITAEDWVGSLVGKNEGTLRNTYSANANVTGDGSVGILAGDNYGSIYSSYSSGDLTARTNVGGIAGYSRGLIQDSYSLANITTTGSASDVGGIVGENNVNGGQIINSYASSTITGTGTNIGGLVGNNGGSISNSYYDKTKNPNLPNEYYGRTTVELTNKDTFWGWDESIWQFSKGNEVEGYEVSLPSLTAVTRSEDISKKTLFDGGFGTETNPYTITNWEHLSNINYIYNDWKNTFNFSLENDLSINTQDYSSFASSTANGGKGWNPIAINSDGFSGFNGIFNGNNHTISDLYINTPNAKWTGLFAFVSNGTIQNLVLDRFNITGDFFTGSLIGQANPNSHIENVIAQNGSVTGVRRVGGLVGALWESDYTILNSHVKNVDVIGSYIVGGLVGEASYSRIVNSSVQGGSVKALFEENANDASGDEVGGLVGSASDTQILNSFANTNVSGENEVGGLVGKSFWTLIQNSYAKGNTNGVTSVGGLVGYIDGSNLENSYSIGKVSGNEDIGGLVGYEMESFIHNSYYDKTVNQEMNDEQIFGKTAAELQNINTFKDGSKYEWSIAEDSTLEKGTPILAWQVDKAGDMNPIWLIGTKVTSKPIIDKPEVETETPNKEIDKVITTIVNKEAVKVPTAPKVTTTPNNSGKNVNVSFSVGENKQIVSKPIEGQATKRVTLSEAKQMQQEVTGETVGDVKVPLSRSSQIVLVNGGVSLPTGVEQEFYVADDEI